MKLLIYPLLILSIVFLGTAQADIFDSIKEHSSMSVTPFFVPPHHEPVFDNNSQGVARYGLRTHLAVQYKLSYWEVEHTFWGLQNWKDIRGISGTDAWMASDWSIEQWGWDLTHTFGVHVTNRLAWWNEYYITSEELCCYHWLTGVKVKLW